jgi:hypothetical protein
MSYKLGEEIDAGGMTFVLPADVARPLPGGSRASADLSKTLTDLCEATTLRATVQQHTRQLEADYRSWKSGVSAAMVMASPKLAVGKITLMVEDSSEFAVRQSARVRAETALTLVDGYVVLLKERLSALKTILGCS